MSHPAQQPHAEMEEAGREAVTLVEDWPFSHLHFDRRARTWIGHVDETHEAPVRNAGSGSLERRVA